MVKQGMDSFIQNVPQLVPESWCLNCRICCRFPDTKEVQTPTWSSLEAEWATEAGGKAEWFESKALPPALQPQLVPCEGSGYRCPAFHPETNRCGIYSVRPLDCRIYPFTLVRKAGGEEVMLAMDLKCPYLQEHGRDPETTAYSLELTQYLNSPLGQAYLKQNPSIVGSHWPEFIYVASLPALVSAEEGSASEPPVAGLNRLTLEQIPMLREVFTMRRHAYSGYTPAALLGWMDLIRLWWIRMEDCLCIFAEQGGGLFMPLPPLGKISLSVVSSVWGLLHQANRGEGVSRIEGWEKAETRVGVDGRWVWEVGEEEYLYRTQEVAELRGNSYRSQRGAINHCLKNRDIHCRPLEEKDFLPCMQLYTRWAIRRQQAHRHDEGYRRMMRDGLFFHRRLLKSHQELKLLGRVFEIDGEVRGYTVGAPVSERTFCIFLETADPDFVGLPQLLFREFCRELKSYALINAMGDSGWAGLRQAKQAYRPIGMIPTFTLRIPAGGAGVDRRGFEPLAS